MANDKILKAKADIENNIRYRENSIDLNRGTPMNYQTIHKNSAEILGLKLALDIIERIIGEQ